MTPESQNFTLGSPSPLAREVFDDIERTALQLVVDGFERWRLGNFERYGDYEDHYTIRLVECMREIRRERNMAMMPQYQHVEPADAMLKGFENPAHARCIDIVISWSLFNDDAYLSIECKRLAPDDLARRYVVEGIDRFVQGHYGAKARTGAMIGYIISGTPTAVLDRVNVLIEKNSGMGSGHTLIPVDPIRWLNTVFASNHSRSQPFPTIRLTHLFFDMNDIEPSQASTK